MSATTSKLTKGGLYETKFKSGIIIWTDPETPVHLNISIPVEYWSETTEGHACAITQLTDAWRHLSCYNKDGSVFPTPTTNIILNITVDETD
jgi:hypothetical protein